MIRHIGRPGTNPKFLRRKSPPFASDVIRIDSYNYSRQWDGRGLYTPVILSRFGRYVVPTLLTPTFRRNLVLISAGRHVVSRCTTLLPRYSHAGATLLSRLTRLTSDTGKFSCVVLRYVSLPPSSSFAVTTLSYAVSRIWRNIACHNVPETWHNGVCIPRTFLHVSATPQSRCTTSCYAIITLAMRCCYVILRCGKRTWISNMFKIQIR